MCERLASVIARQEYYVDLNPFEDWLKAVAGPKRSLGKQVMDNDEHMQKFQVELTEKLEAKTPSRHTWKNLELL